MPAGTTHVQLPVLPFVSLQPPISLDEYNQKKPLTNLMDPQHHSEYGSRVPVSYQAKLILEGAPDDR